MFFFTTTALITYLSGIFILKNITEVGQLLLIIPIFKGIIDTYKSKKISLSKSSLFLCLFFLIAIVSTLINSENIPKLSKVLYNMRAPLFGIFLLFLLPNWIRDGSSQIKKWVFSIFLISLIISSLYGVFCFFWYDQPRLEGFLHIMKQGYGSALILSILFPAFLHRSKMRAFFPTELAIITMIVAFIAMTLTFTRGAMLGFLCSIPFSLFFYRKKWAYTAILLIGIVTGIQVSYYLFGAHDTSIRFLVTKENNSDNIRKSLWQASLYAIKEKPILGWGYHNLSPQMKRLKDDYDLPRKDWVDTHAHNNFLEIAAGTGMIGLSAYLMWLIFWFYESLKGNQLVKILVIPFFVTFLITGLFELTLDHRLAIILFFFYALTTSINKEKTSIK